jgi:hypothetical protein
MHWIKRLSLNELQDAERLSELHTAEELLRMSERQGTLDMWFRHRWVPLSALIPYVFIGLYATGLRPSSIDAGVAGLLGLTMMLVVIIVAREVWYRWCVIELAYRVRVAKDARIAGEREAEPAQRRIEDSPHFIPE